VLETLKAWAGELKSNVVTLWFACRDPRVPTAAKILALAVVAYALSPIDLIPDFIPVLGYVDDLILVPLGVYFAMQLIPRPIWEQARLEAHVWEAAQQSRPRSYVGAAVIIAIWLAAGWWLWKLFF
jgi:uncharacterized membrane protein YkvA (DUF1232 family)